MSEFQAYEFTDIDSAAAAAAESVLQGVRERYRDAAYWRRVFGTPSLASRAARAAEHQGPALAEAVLRRLREATAADGRPVDDLDRLREVLAGVPKLNRWRVIRELDSADVVWSVDADASLTRRRGCPFPTVLFRGPAGDRVVTGAQPLPSYVAAIDAVAPAVRSLARAA